MHEFTEKHHAFISAMFYVLLTEKFGERGEAAFVHATQRYAEQQFRDIPRLWRMGQHAERKGRGMRQSGARSLLLSGFHGEGYYVPVGGSV